MSLLEDLQEKYKLLADQLIKAQGEVTYYQNQWSASHFGGQDEGTFTSQYLAPAQAKVDALGTQLSSAQLELQVELQKEAAASSDAMTPATPAPAGPPADLAAEPAPAGSAFFIPSLIGGEGSSSSSSWMIALLVIAAAAALWIWRAQLRRLWK